MQRNRRTPTVPTPALILIVIGLLIPVSATAQEAGEARFPVTHLHATSQCVGYIYISANRVRFEVIQPDTDKKHGFDIARTDMQNVQQWILLGTPQNAVEIRTAGGNYHFLLLPDTADLQRTPPRQWGVRSAVPIGTLIAALQGTTTAPPATVTAPATSMATGSAPSTRSSMPNVSGANSLGEPVR